MQALRPTCHHPESSPRRQDVSRGAGQPAQFVGCPHTSFCGGGLVLWSTRGPWLGTQVSRLLHGARVGVRPLGTVQRRAHRTAKGLYILSKSMGDRHSRSHSSRRLWGKCRFGIKPPGPAAVCGPLPLGPASPGPGGVCGHPQPRPLHPLALTPLSLLLLPRTQATSPQLCPRAPQRPESWP